ncbi:hypothetical protein [Ethanoligenens sp.]|uniref:hypothetical protein n=1 Tax=Ethanoligenens sp. TaxID=2099655 RepID=UPI0039E79804
MTKSHYCISRIKIAHSVKFGIIKALRPDAATCKDKVLDGCSGYMAQDINSIFIRLFSKSAAISGMEEVLHIDFQRAIYRACGGGGQTVGHVPLCHTIAFLQSFHDSCVMFLPQLPQPWFPRAFARPCIRYVKNIFHSFIFYIQKSNTGCSTLNPAVHPLVPDWISGHSGSVWALGADQQLIGERIFVNAGSRVQKLHPCFRGFCHIQSCLL